MNSKLLLSLFFIFLINFVTAVPSISIELTTDKEEYVIGEDIVVTVFIHNKGDVDMSGVGYKVVGVSELNPSIKILDNFSLPQLSVAAGKSFGPINPPNIDTAGLETGVYTFTAVITNYVAADGRDDISIADNVSKASVVLVNPPPTSVPEIPNFFVVFIILTVLFILRRD